MKARIHRAIGTHHGAARSSFEALELANPPLKNDRSPILSVRTIALLGILVIIAALVAKA